MPSRKKLKHKGKGKQKKEMRQLANATAAEIIRGIHDGKLAGGHQFDRLECDGITEAMLKNLQQCDESLASVFGSEKSLAPVFGGAQDQFLTSPPTFCLRILLAGAIESHNRRKVCRDIAEGISPVVKCMVHERRVFFQSTEAWYDSE